MKVAFDLPDPLWFKLAETDIAGIVVGALTRAAQSEERVSSISRWHAAGLCDADIGLKLGMTSGAVAEARRGLGLPANRRYRKKESI